MGGVWGIVHVPGIVESILQTVSNLQLSCRGQSELAGQRPKKKAVP